MTNDGLSLKVLRGGQKTPSSLREGERFLCRLAGKTVNLLRPRYTPRLEGLLALSRPDRGDLKLSTARGGKNQLFNFQTATTS